VKVLSTFSYLLFNENIFTSDRNLFCSKVAGNDWSRFLGLLVKELFRDDKPERVSKLKNVLNAMRAKICFVSYSEQIFTSRFCLFELL